MRYQENVVLAYVDHLSALSSKHNTRVNSHQIEQTNGRQLIYKDGQNNNCTCTCNWREHRK